MPSLHTDDLLPDQPETIASAILSGRQRLPAQERLTVESVRQLIITEHGKPLSKDDPILMLVTMHEAFLNEYEGILEKHKEAISTFMKRVSSHYANKVESSTNELLEKAVQASITNVLDTVAEHTRQMEKHSQAVKAYAIATWCGFGLTSLLIAAWLIVELR